jgi:photosystem II stability/assembly factor-like uncharacterized protein
MIPLIATARISILSMFFAVVCTNPSAQAWQTQDDFWRVLPTGTSVSLRGLEMCSDGETVWACGSNSTVIRSDNLGKSWKTVSPIGFEKLEFRSITAWDSQRAMIASAGTPAVVLATKDGGQTWQEILRRPEEKAFFDALKFFDKQRGILFSDPVDDKWLILITSDGGQKWQEVAKDSIPKLQVDEAAFAASNSALHVNASGRAWLGTGGVTGDSSRVYYSTDFGQTWVDSLCPIPSGEAAGIFSIASSPEGRLVAVGGDYRPEQRSRHTSAFSDDDGKTWRLAAIEPTAFRSSIVTVPHPTKPIIRWVTTGPSGTDISEDGSSWKSVSMTGFHVLATHPNGTLIAVGSDGRFGIADLK